MTISKYEDSFHELSKHGTRVLPIEQERVCYFICGLRLLLWIKTKLMVLVGFSFLDSVDHARTMEKLRRKAQEGIDKSARHQGSFSSSHSRGRDSYDRPHQHFQ